MSQIKVSIVIPVYNVEKYLRECVDSAVRQTLKAIEIILVDDGSTDRGGEICDEYAAADSRVRVIHKQNGGLSSARNAGLAVAGGEYIYFLDSDDYIELDAMARLYREASERALDMILFTARSFVDGALQDYSVVGDYDVYHHHVDEVMSGIDFLKYAAEDHEYIAQTCMRFYSAGLFENGKRLSYHEGIIHEDEDVGVITLLQSERVVKLNAPLYHRRYRSGSIMTRPNHAASAKGYLFAAGQMLKYYDAAAREDVRALLIGRYESYINSALRDYGRATRRERRSIAKDARELGARLGKKRYPLTRRKYALCLVHPALAMLANEKDRRNALRALSDLDPQATRKYRAVRRGRGARMFLLGSPVHGNLGDHLIALSQLDYLKRAFPGRTAIDCTMPFSNIALEVMRNSVRPADVICVSGGGWLGTKWRHNEEFVRRVIASFPNNPIVIFPQTVYYDGEPEYSARGARLYSGHGRLLFCVREKASYEYILRHGFVREARALLMPDFALLYRDVPAREAAPRRGIMLCLRDDVEKQIDDAQARAIRAAAEGFDETTEIQTNIAPAKVGTAERRARVAEKLSEIGRCRLLITDRLHAMIFAALTGTPCLALDNATHKVYGVHEWIGALDYVRLADDAVPLETQIARLLERGADRRVDELGLSKYEEILKQRITELERGQ